MRTILRWLIRIAVVAALFVAVGLISARLRRPGPVLYTGGPILTMDADGRVVEALAVEGERIAAAGTRAELQAWADERGAPSSNWAAGRSCPASSTPTATSPARAWRPWRPT